MFEYSSQIYIKLFSLTSYNKRNYKILYTQPIKKQFFFESKYFALYINHHVRCERHIIYITEAAHLPWFTKRSSSIWIYRAYITKSTTALMPR